jgi:hypothetical protein
LVVSLALIEDERMRRKRGSEEKCDVFPLLLFFLYHLSSFIVCNFSL